MKTISRATAEHYRWGQSCEGWHLVKDAGLSVIQELMPPGTSEVRHFHPQAQQFFFVLAGEAWIEVNGEVRTLRAGEGVHISPGMAHQIRNPSPRPVEFLVVSQPPGQGDRMPA